jgi:DNA-binding response OmpR family regulator
LEVIEAGSLHEARAAVATGRTDLILMDRRLPDGDGLDLTRTLKSDPSSAGIPVIVVTAETGEATEAACREAGAAACVLKPFRPDDLITRVAEALRLELRTTPAPPPVPQAEAPLPVLPADLRETLRDAVETGHLDQVREIVGARRAEMGHDLAQRVEQLASEYKLEALLDLLQRTENRP